MSKKGKTIKEKIKCLLWGKSAGRCQICGKPVYINEGTGTEGNFSELAHNLPISRKGPRAEYIIDDTKDRNDIDNLILVCLACHHEIDDERSEYYTPDVLYRIKCDFEEHVFKGTDFKVIKDTYKIIYLPNLHSKSNNILIPYYLSGKCVLKTVEISMKNYSSYAITWNEEKNNLIKNFDEYVAQLIDKGNVNFSIFALAPIPLLILLGRLLSNKHDIDVYQYQKHPQTWLWQEYGDKLNYQVNKKYIKRCKKPILILSLSGKVEEERIRQLFPNIKYHSIYKIELENPSDDFLKCKEQKDDFFKVFSKLKEEIANSHRGGKIHLFAAIPISIAIEIGMQKNDTFDLPIVTYNLYDDKYEKVYEI